MQPKEIARLVLQVLVAALTAALTALGFSSCSTTRASITRPADNSSTIITISTNNPVSANPALDINVPVNVPVKSN